MARTEENTGTGFRGLVWLLGFLCAIAGCDGDGGTGTPGPNVAGRWIYRAVDLHGTQVSCSTSQVVLTLVRIPGSLRLDARFDGSAFAFRLECRQGERSATILFTDGTSVVNGEIRDDVVAFDFGFPDFLHTGTLGDGSMSGTVATRLDLSGTPLSEVGIVNLVGEWEAVRD